ncbi:MAG: hypothetical protein AB7I27_03775 [Bacteriovoracaceae bacterium]
MEFIKFSFLIILVSFGVNAQTRFSSKSCLDATYRMKMNQKGPLFGLLQHEFLIEKKNCVIRINHRKYLPKEWIVDVCREPIHIKVTSATGVDVAKKEEECTRKDKSKDTSDFCSQYNDMMDVIQDDGLIFAEGDRDNLSSDHGKTFCAYLLLKKYLNDSVVFSKYTEVPEIFMEGKKQPEVAPTPVPAVAPAKDKLESKNVELNKEATVNGLLTVKLNSAQGV